MSDIDALMRVGLATAPGDAAIPNEDHVAVRGNVVVVLDGQTTRTATGCVHGVPWYVARLAEGMLAEVSGPLPDVLSRGIRHVSGLHRDTCDLSHAGTPAATVAALRVGIGRTDYLVLGDATVVVESTDGRLRAISDLRVNATAPAERAAADRHAIGSAAKQEALVRMKRAELAERNTPDGYWVAAADPDAALHGIHDSVPTSDLRRAVVATDGISRLVDVFDAMTWAEILTLAEEAGPEAVIRAVRQHEERDPHGVGRPRNKKSDDASLVLLSASAD